MSFFWWFIIITFSTGILFLLLGYFFIKLLFPKEDENKNIQIMERLIISTKELRNMGISHHYNSLYPINHLILRVCEIKEIDINSIDSYEIENSCLIINF